MILRRNLVNILVFLLPLLIIFLVKDLSFNNDIWLSKFDPIDIVEQYRKNEFLNNKETLIVKIDIDKSFFTKETIDKTRILVDEINNLADVYSIKSPLHSSYIVNHDEILNIQTFDSALENGIIENLEKYRSEFEKSDYFGLLLSKDYKEFLLDIKVDVGEKNKHAKRQKVINEIDKILLKSEFKNYNLAGKLFLDYQLNELSKSNLVKLFAVVVLVIFLILFLIYQNITKLFITLYVAIIASCASLLVIKGFCDYLTTINIVLPLIIIAIAISDGVHILAKWQYLCLNLQEISKEDRLRKLIKLTYKPCLITSITTSIGFGSFYFSDIVPLKDFALQSTVSIMLAYVIITGLTWFLVYVNSIEDNTGVDFTFMKNKIPNLVNYVIKHQIIVVSVTLILLLFFSYGLTKIYTQSSFLNIFFKKDSQIYQTFIQIDQSLGGSGEIDLIIKSTEKDNFQTLEKLNYIQNVSNEVAKHRFVNHVRSYVNPVMSIHKEIRSEDSRLPSNDEEFAQEILFLEFSRSDKSSDVLSDYVNFSYSAARINIRTDNLTSKQTGSLISYIKDIIDEPVLTGHNMYFYQISHYVNQTQIKSIFVTLITIFVVMLVFYNLRISLIALCLNIIPVVIVAGLIAHLGIAFDFATVMISAISFAIAVDNSIHLIDNHNRLKMEDKIQRVIDNLRYICTPLIINTILFGVTFLIFTFSDLVLLIKFGFFSFVAIICAFVVNIVLSGIFLSLTVKNKSY